LKVRFQTRIYLIRGGHESTHMNQLYGFYNECVRKYGNSVIWRDFNELFNFLPLTALIDNQVIIFNPVDI
jgi:serine/threonine-protein phosphatase 2A catalytic subunit